jgi:hypothetical protein
MSIHAFHYFLNVLIVNKWTIKIYVKASLRNFIGFEGFYFIRIFLLVFFET